MSKYYHPNRTRNLYSENFSELFRLSRSKIDLYLNCPRCFYLDRRLGVAQPPGYPFSLNSAVDKLLKKEFDIHRANGTPHPLMKAYALDAVPLAHEKINEWRDALRAGITFKIDGENVVITGGVDDVWVKPDGEFLIVDYKATSKDDEVTLDADWQIGYKRQMEIYQWLFRKNGFRVSTTGYFVYCNGDTDREAFDGKLEFDIKIIPYIGDDSWVEKTVLDAIDCLKNEAIPESGEDCDYCAYRKAVLEVETTQSGNRDTLFYEAVKVIKDEDVASASRLQRRFGIGYARACRLLDQLENAGLIGPAEGSSPRKVLIKENKSKNKTIN